jgi:hypothetical protein
MRDMRALADRTLRIIAALCLIVATGLVSLAHASPFSGYADMPHEKHGTMVPADVPHHSMPSHDDHAMAQDALCYAACTTLAGIGADATRLAHANPVIPRTIPNIRLQAGLSPPPGKRPPKPVSIL